MYVARKIIMHPTAVKTRREDPKKRKDRTIKTDVLVDCARHLMIASPYYIQSLNVILEKKCTL